MPRYETDVLIVGAGPTGMALALALVRQGIRPLLLDRQSAGANTSRAVVIHARTLEVLEPLGLAAPLLSRGVKVPKFRVRDRDRVLLDIGFEHLQTAYPFTLMCTQDVTEALLWERLQEVGVEVIRPAEVTTVRIGSEGVEADFRGDAALQTIHANWLVGCDGGHSLVRRSAGIAFEGAAYEEEFVLADVQLQWPLSREEVSLFYSPEGLLVVAPIPGDLFRLVASVAHAPEELTMEFIQDLITRRGPGRDSGVVRELRWTSRFHLQHRVAEAVFRGRVLLCGDAAHVHSPAGGQGMNTGIQDATSLAMPLAQAVRSLDTDGLAKWATTRQEIATNVVAMTHRMTRAATLKSAPLQLLRNAALAVAGHFPELREKMAHSLAELDNR